MKKFLSLVLLMVRCVFTMDAQNPEMLNAYQFVFIPPLTYEKGKNDIYGIRNTIVEKLTGCGVPLFLEENEISREAMKNPCSMIHCLVGNSSAPATNYSMVKILFLDCK